MHIYIYNFMTKIMFIWIHFREAQTKWQSSNEQMGYWFPGHQLLPQNDFHSNLKPGIDAIIPNNTYGEK